MIIELIFYSCSMLLLTYGLLCYDFLLMLWLRLLPTYVFIFWLSKSLVWFVSSANICSSLDLTYYIVFFNTYRLDIVIFWFLLCSSLDSHCLCFWYCSYSILRYRASFQDECSMVQEEFSTVNDVTTLLLNTYAIQCIHIPIHLILIS